MIDSTHGSTPGIQFVCQNIRLIKLEFQGHVTASSGGKAVKVSREVKSTISGQLEVDGFRAILTVGNDLDIKGSGGAQIAEFRIEHELQYWRTSDSEPPEDDEIRAIFIDGQATVGSLVRERVLSLTAALGIRPVVLQYLPHQSVADAVGAYHMIEDDSGKDSGGRSDDNGVMEESGKLGE